MMETEKKEKICPGCGGLLREVFAAATYGRVLLLDQCGLCGGVWFDRWELYFLGPGEAERLDSVDVPALMALNPSASGTGRCPVCSEPLVDFKDPSLAPDACIRRCPGCSGLWLNRGELTKYAGHRAAMKGAGTAAVSPPDLKTLKNLPTALDTSAISRPLSPPAMDDSPVTPGEMARDLAPIILQILLRMMF